MEPFGKNLKNFIFANDMTRQKFADELNKLLEEKDENAKIYSANDIWTYDSRGSMPKNGATLSAMAEIIGKPLEQLLVCEFSQEELRSSIWSSGINSEESGAKPTQWSIDKLSELTEEEVEFIFDLVAAGVCEEDGKWRTYFDVGLRYNGGKSVAATMYYGFDAEEERTFEWTWQEYGEEIQAHDDECYILETRLDSEIFGKFRRLGLFGYTWCSKCDLSELCDELRFDFSEYFVVSLDFDTDKDEMRKLLEKAIEHSQNKLAVLVEQARIMAIENNSGSGGV